MVTSSLGAVQLFHGVVFYLSDLAVYDYNVDNASEGNPDGVWVRYDWNALVWLGALVCER